MCIHVQESNTLNLQKLWSNIWRHVSGNWVNKSNIDSLFFYQLLREISGSLAAKAPYVHKLVSNCFCLLFSVEQVQWCTVGVWNCYTENSCLLRLKTAPREQWEWSRTVEVKALWSRGELQIQAIILRRFVTRNPLHNVALFSLSIGTLLLKKYWLWLL